VKKINSRTVIALCAVVLSIIWIYLGITKYGLWDSRKGPLPGLFPTGIASVLLVTGTIGAIQSLKEKRAAYKREAFEVIAGLLLLLAGSYTIGILPSLLIFFVLWQIFIEKMPVRTVIISTLVMSAIVLGVFVFWLKVPFEKGILFEFILK